MTNTSRFVWGLCLGGVPSIFLLFATYQLHKASERKSLIIANQGVALVKCATSAKDDTWVRESYIKVILEYYSEEGISDKAAAHVVFSILAKRPTIEGSLSPKCRIWFKEMIRRYGDQETMAL